MCSECGWDYERPEENCANCGSTYEECDCGNYEPKDPEDMTND